MDNGGIPSVWDVDPKTGVAVNTAVKELEKRYVEMEQKLGLRSPTVRYRKVREFEEDSIEDLPAPVKVCGLPNVGIEPDNLRPLDKRYAAMEKELWKPVEVEVATVNRSRRRGALKVAIMPLAFVGGIYVLRGIFGGHWNVADLPSYVHDLITGGNGAQSAVHLNTGGVVQHAEYLPQLPEQHPIEIPAPVESPPPVNVPQKEGNILSFVPNEGGFCQGGLDHTGWGHKHNVPGEVVVKINDFEHSKGMDIRINHRGQYNSFLIQMLENKGAEDPDNCLKAELAKHIY